MTAPHVCPDRATLARFAVGSLASSQVEPLAAHVEECPECVARVATLSGTDTLVEAVRGQASLTDLPEASLLSSLLARVVRQNPIGLRTIGVEHVPEPTVSAPEGRPITSPDDPSDEYARIGQVGGYLLQGVLGMGGMGVVYKGYDPLLRKEFAVKVINPRLAARPVVRRRFFREAQAAAKLDHDHVAAVLRVGEENGVPFLVMPLLQGQSLEDRLRTAGSLPLGECLEFARQIARGLDAAHRAGLIHRDIKPANLWVEPGPPCRVKLLDFGLARPLDDADAPPVSEAGTILGTVEYMAPEQARSDELDAGADLFSLGVVLYRMATGVRPFRGTSTVAVLTAVATHTPPAPHTLNPAVPPAVSAYIMRLLEKERANRPRSAAEVADALAAFQANIPRPAARRRWLGWAVGAGVAALLLAGGLILAQLLSPKEAPKGTVVVDTNDPAAVVTVRLDGKVLWEKEKSRKFDLPPGEYEFEVHGGVKLATMVKGPVEVKNGATDKFPAIFRLPDERTASAPPPESATERELAEWFHTAVKADLTVEVDGKRVGIPSPSRGKETLPAADFRVVGISFYDDSRTATAEELRQIARLKSLTEIDLNQRTAPDAGVFEQLKTLPKLTTLWLQSLKLDAKSLEHVGAMTGLRELHLTSSTFPDGKFLRTLKQLERLQLSHSTTDDEVLDSVRELTELQTLWLDALAGVTDQGLSRLDPLTKLTFLDLDGTTKAGNAGLEVIAKFPELKTLRMAGTAVTADGLKHLAKVPKLTELYYGSRALTSASVQSLKHLSALAHLKIDEEEVTEDDFAELAKLPNLAWLTVQRSRRLAAGAVKPLAGSKSLRTLTFDDVPLTDDDLRALEPLASRLDTLTLTGTKVTPEAVADLTKTAPKCKITGPEKK